MIFLTRREYLNLVIKLEPIDEPKLVFWTIPITPASTHALSLADTWHRDDPSLFPRDRKASSHVWTRASTASNALAADVSFMI